VSNGEIEEFVLGSPTVAGWLGKYKDASATYLKYSRGLCMFFKWLRVVKGLKFSPEEFLDRLASARASVKPSERCWGKSLVLQFSRDNPDLAGHSDSAKLTSYLVPLKRFCADNEVELTTEQSLMGVVKRKFSEPPFTVELAKKVLGVLGQRERAICLTMLQSGQSVTQVLVDINKQVEYVIRELEAGKERIRFDFLERKGNNFPYHSFIGHDAITEIKKWLPLRREILDELGVDSSPYLFITKTGKQFRPHMFLSQYTRTLQRKGLWTGPLSVRSHMFRKIFETEASPPDRGIDKVYVKFMMSHSSGTNVVKKQDMPGGIYDNAPKVFLDVVEREYEKLEPYLNIYTGKRSIEELPISEAEWQDLKELLSLMKEGKVRIAE